MSKTPEELADRIERQAILCVSLLAMNDGEYFAAKKAYIAGYQSRDLEVTSLEEEIAMLKAELRKVGND
jgi:hypothetical protein